MTSDYGTAPLGSGQGAPYAGASRTGDAAPGVFQREFDIARLDPAVRRYQGGPLALESNPLALLGGQNPLSLAGSGLPGLGSGGNQALLGYLGLLALLGTIGGAPAAAPAAQGASGPGSQLMPHLLQTLLVAVNNLIGVLKGEASQTGATLPAGQAAVPAAGPATGTGSAPRPGRYEDLVARPMAIEEFPRPAGDNGRGMHWIPTTTQEPHVIDRFVREAEEMGVKWVVFLNYHTEIGPNDYLMRKLEDAGIEPIMRIYTDSGEPIKGDIGALVRHARSFGVDYFQLYNEPNLRGENQGQAPDPNRYVGQWLPAAKEVIEAGGLPGFGSLAPGGDYDDLEFLEDAIAALRRQGEERVLNRSWLSMHNYTLGHGVDEKAENGFRKFEFYDDLLNRTIGRSIPILGTEGGTHIDWHAPEGERQIDEALQTERVLDAYRYMQERREPWNFVYSYWVIANEEGGGLDAAFSKQALFQPGYTSPIVDALKALSSST